MREIKEIIIHCTATPEGREVSVAEIDRWHRERGFNGIGYHFVVGLDGKVYKGRDVATVGAHCAGHNANSIGVAYVGGVDGALRPKDTRTAAQRAAIVALVKKLKCEYPLSAVHGHNEFASKDCPSFDVQKWLKEERL
ncbi:MAG: N-acetylmuramoyl-L-alanine amidase [Bacteroidales bacterium]